MTSRLKQDRFEIQKLDGKGMRVGIVRARWNFTVIDSLTQSAKLAMTSRGVSEGDIVEVCVPGSFELPFAAKSLILSQAAAGTPLDAVICIGTLIKGSTMHFEYICDATSHAIMQVGLETGTPAIFGVLTCLTEEQALERAGLAGPNENEGHNHGDDWGITALEMGKMKYKGAAEKSSAKSCPVMPIPTACTLALMHLPLALLGMYAFTRFNRSL